MKKILVLLLVLCCCGSLFAEKYMIDANIRISDNNTFFHIHLIPIKGNVDYAFVILSDSLLGGVVTNAGTEVEYAKRVIDSSEDDYALLYDVMKGASLPILLHTPEKGDGDYYSFFASLSNVMIDMLDIFFEEEFLIIDKLLLEGVEVTNKETIYIEYNDYFEFLDAKEQFERFKTYFYIEQDISF